MNGALRDNHFTTPHLYREKEMQLTTFMGQSALTLTLCVTGWSLTFQATAENMQSEPQNLIQSPKQSKNSPITNLGLPFSNGVLAGLRGGFETVNNDLQLNGSVANNSATHVVSGNNYIAGGSFSNMTGLPIAVQNSGSNVLIQNATIVNVKFQ